MGDLIERSAEIAAVESSLDAAVRGSGRSLVVAGRAGIGKTALVEHAREVARGAGFTVLRSCPTPVSSMLSHGVVRDWLGPLLRSSRPGEPPFDGPARTLAAALRSTPPGEPDREPAWSLATVDHALSWVVETLVARGPLLLVVDDAHWADAGSLQLLDLLSARLQSTRAMLLLGVRTGEGAGVPALLDRLTARAVTLRLQPLSTVGVEQLRRRHGDAAPEIARLSTEELHRRTGGVPFLLEHLLRADSADRAPQGVVESVRERLDRLGVRATGVARTTAALGDDATFDAVADLTGMTVSELADPLELLADAGLLSLGMWQARPAHPLVAEAILSSMSPSERSQLHRPIADYLADAGAPREVVSSHLLHTLPGEDPAVVALLRDTGAAALSAGAPEVAARHLLRALGETRPEDTDPALLALAATAHLSAGAREEAFDLWRRALDRTPDPLARAQLLADIGDAQMTAGSRAEAKASHAEALAILRRSGLDIASPRMRPALVRIGLVRSLYDGVSADVLTAVADTWRQPPEDDTNVDRRLFALAGADLATRAQERGRALELARRAVGEGALLAEETSDGIGFYTVTAVLTWCEAFEEALDALGAAVDDARSRGSVLGFATASYCRGLALQRQGRLQDAAAEFQAALELRERGWPHFGDPAVAGAATTQLCLGRLDAALELEPALRAAARRGQFVNAQSFAAAGMVRAAHGDHEQALADFSAAARLMGSRRDNAAIVEWRELSALSLIALGRLDEARDLAEEAIVHARTWGGPRALGLSLRTLARLRPHEERDGLLREALALLEGGGILDQLARARLDLAALLLARGDRAARAEAVGLMRLALDYGRGHDVGPVSTRAKRLLLRAGEAVSALGIHPAAALTPSERRVAELAAAGDTNRRIAEKLFVTVKAVEWHLSNTYRKLGISSRTALAEALYGDPGDSSSSLM